MEKRDFNIPNISCKHCTGAIKDELSQIEGVRTVEGNVEGKSVTVEWDAPATEGRIIQILKEINYPPAQ